jgi:hypothetical protein
MVVRSMADRRIRIGAAPGQNGRAVHDEVARTDEAAMPRQAYDDH